MKKLLFVFILLSFFTFGVVAQTRETTDLDINSISEAIQKKESRFSLNAHSGYAFAMGSSFKYFSDDITAISMQQVGNSSPTKSVTYTSPTKGLGQGLRFGVGVSYIINDFINVGLDVDYFRSTISKSKDSSFLQKNITGGLNGMESYYYDEQTKSTYTASLLTFSPNITFKAITMPKWFLYNKLGAVITFGPNSTQHDMQTTTQRIGWQGFIRESVTSNTKKYDWGIKNPAYGFMGGVGAQFKLSKKVRLYGELQFSHIVFVVRSRTLTDFIVDGIDRLNTLPLSQREVQYSSSFTINQTTSGLNEPARAVTERIPITYLGFQTGVSFRL